MKKESIYVSGSNYFNEEDLQKAIKLLDEGNTINIGISCIGHTRHNMEQENYKKALIEHYGDLLEIKTITGAYCYIYEYTLKGV